jgi:D-xylose transport system substrate-binding protein
MNNEPTDQAEPSQPSEATINSPIAPQPPVMGSESLSPQPPVTAPAVVVAPSPQKSSQKWLLLVVIILLIVAVAGGVVWWWTSHESAVKPAAVASTTPKYRIGLSLDTLKELRWAKDRDLMTARAQANGASVTTLVADSNDQTQIAQIENLIAQRVNVLIVVPHDAKAVAPTIAEAHKAGIKVIAYDRLILDSDLDMYVSFDSTKVGQYEAQNVMNAVPKTVAVPNVVLIGGSPSDNNALLVHTGMMSVLQPLVSAGKAKIVLDQYSADWSPDIAYTNVKQYLAGGGKVDAVIAANDGTASGVVRALQEKSLAGKVPVSGQDAELPAVQRIVAGTQTVTVYKPIQLLANKAIDTALAFAKGKAPASTGTVNNGQKNVTSYLLSPTPVLSNNIRSTVIKDGFLSSKDVYGTN